MQSIKCCQPGTGKGLHVLVSQQACLAKEKVRRLYELKTHHDKLLRCIAAVKMGRSYEKNFLFSIQVFLKCYPFTSTWCCRLTFFKAALDGFFGVWFELEVQKSWLPCTCMTEFEDNSEFCSWKLCSMHVQGSAEVTFERKDMYFACINTAVEPDSFWLFCFC